MTGGSPHLLRTLVQMDAPDHPKYRLLTQAWFLPQNIRSWRTASATSPASHVDRMAALGGECDFARDVALTLSAAGDHGDAWACRARTSRAC